MLTPKLDLKNFNVQEKTDYCLIKNMATQQEYKLELADALLLKCIDGSKDVRAIKNEISQLLSYEVSDEIVWKAIDVLSDIGILQTELAPPSGGQLTSRRGFLAKVAGTLAIGTAMASSPAFAQQSAEEKQKRAAAEQQQKADQRAAEQNAKNPVTVNSPATLSLLAIGAASMALINLRNKKNKGNNESDD